MTTSLRIWVVDDDCDEHILLKWAVASLRSPVELRCIESAMLAQQLLALTAPEKWPQLLVSDIKMPVMDGFEFLDWVRHSRWKAIPVVLCSNSQSDRDVTRAYQLRANAYHVKPSSMDGLKNCYSAMTKYWGELVVLPTPA